MPLILKKSLLTELATLDQLKRFLNINATFRDSILYQLFIHSRVLGLTLLVKRRIRLFERFLIIVLFFIVIVVVVV